MVDLPARRVEVLGSVAHPTQALKGRPGEIRYRACELRADGILHGHARSPTTGGTQPLLNEQCRRSHAIRIVRSDECPIDIAGSKATISSQQTSSGSFDDCRR